MYRPTTTDKNAIYSFGLIWGLFYFVGLAHEAGHALVCTITDGSFSWYWFFLLETKCIPLPESLLEYWAMGGLFGMTSCLIPTFTKIRRHRNLLVALYASSVMQFMFFLFESFNHGSYMSTDGFSFILIGTIVGLVWLSLFRKFNKKIDNHS